MAGGRLRERTVLVRLRRALPGLLIGSAIRRLLTLIGLVVAGWLLGGAGAAHAGTAAPESATTPLNAVSAMTRSVVPDTAKEAGGMVAPSAARQAIRRVHRIGRALTGTVSTPPARAGRFFAADAQEPVFPDARKPGASSSCTSIRDLVRVMHEARPARSISTPRILTPGGLTQVIALGAPLGSTTAGSAGSGDSWVLRHHLGWVAAQGERTEPDVRELAPTGAPKNVDGGRTAKCQATSHSVPRHAARTHNQTTPGGRSPSLNGPVLPNAGAAYLQGVGSSPTIAVMPAPGFGSAPPAVRSAAHEPSFSPD